MQLDTEKSSLPGWVGMILGYSVGDWGGWGRNLLLPSSLIRY